VAALALGIGVTGYAVGEAGTDSSIFAASALAGPVSAADSSWPDDDSAQQELTEGEYAEGVVDIVLGETISISGQGAAVEGNTVVITAAGVYSIKGTLAAGQIRVDAKGKVYLEFGGVDITSDSGPALNIIDAKKVTLTLVEGTTNYLADKAGDGQSDAALFTNDTLVVNGKGTLIVTGNNVEGIASDDDLIIESGTIRVNAVDDGLNAHDDITINGGYVFITAGGDGIDSNGTVNMNGGTVVSFGGTAQGEGGIDALGAFTITGGTLVAGGNNIAAPCEESTQPSLYVDSGTMLEAGTLIHVEREGQGILTFSAPNEFQNVLFSSGELARKAVYEVTLGGTSTGTPTDGFYNDGTYTAVETGTLLSVGAAIIPDGAGVTDPVN
jgi:hypothetical protein